MHGPDPGDETDWPERPTRYARATSDVNLEDEDYRVEP